MSGYFKIVDAHDGGYRIKLMAGDGGLVAVSTYYPTKPEAVAGIDEMREIAGTGPVTDQSRGYQLSSNSAGKRNLSGQRR